MLQLIRELREISGAGMLDVKKALTDTSGNKEDALKLLRERGSVKKLRDLTSTKHGIISMLISADQRQGSLVELNCETDFVALNEGFQKSALEFHVPDDDNTQYMLTVMQRKFGEAISVGKSRAWLSDNHIYGYLHMNKIGVLLEVSGIDSKAANDIAMHIAAEKPTFLDRSEVSIDDLEKEKETLTNKALNEGKPQAIVDKIVTGQLNKYYEENVLLEQPFVKDPTKTIADFVGLGRIVRFVRLEVGK